MSRGQAGLVGLAAAAFLFAGAVLWVLPVRVPGPADALPPRPQSEEADVARAPGSDAYLPVDAYRDVVDGDVFASTRRGPAPDLAGRAAEPSRRPLRLVGIVRGPGGAIALIEGPAASTGGGLYRVGDAVDAYRVREVGDSTVLLVGAQGTLLLRLDTTGGGR